MALPWLESSEEDFSMPTDPGSVIIFDLKTLTVIDKVTCTRW